MSFTDTDRQRLAALADVLIPASDGMPSASQADVAGQWLDVVSSTCPDLAAGLVGVLQRVGSGDAAAGVADLRSFDPAAFAVLAEFAATAYFLNPAVRQAIGYAGQGAQPIDTHPDYLDDGLLDAVVRRGPIYRPTPPPATK